VLALAEKCTGCLVCQLRCSFRFEKEFNPSRSAITIHRLVGADDEYAISFTPQCDNCGICARFCPYEALTWAKGKGAA
jgi:ferredoxin